MIATVPCSGSWRLAGHTMEYIARIGPELDPNPDERRFEQDVMSVTRRDEMYAGNPDYLSGAETDSVAGPVAAWVL
ncbi:MAG: hypothetical protein ABI560_14805, partial [Myxococcales bacterium]